LLDEEAQREETRGQAGYWLEVCESGREATYTDPRADQKVEGRPVAVQQGRLDLAEHARFVALFPTARQQHDAFLAAFAWAWGAVTGRPRFFVQLVNHGREPLRGRLPWRTVGWLTSSYPTTLEVTGASPEALLERASGAAAAPQGGLGFGLLRHLSSDAGIHAALARAPQPQVGLTFYGGMYDIFRAGDRLPFLNARSFSGTRPEAARGYVADMELAVRQRYAATWWDLAGTRSAFGEETIKVISEKIGEYLRACLQK